MMFFTHPGQSSMVRLTRRGGGVLTVMLLVVFSPFAVTGQEKSPESSTPALISEGEDTIKISTDLVTLTLTITDNYGRYVSGLNKQAFTILDNNQPQQISFFSDADAPASVGILFDFSNSMTGEKVFRARQALEKFISLSHPRDEYFLIGFNKSPQLLVDRTRNGGAVLDKLTFIKPKGNTALYDAVYLGTERVLRGAHQKKVLLLISDGQDNSSRYNFGEVRRFLKESDVIIYSVGILNEADASSILGEEGQAYLEELSGVTGGKCFFPQTDAELDEIFERIAVEIRRQYTIGYVPNDFVPDGKWRKVKVRLKVPRGLPRMSVRGREGYYAAPKMPFK